MIILKVTKNQGFILSLEDLSDRILKTINLHNFEHRMQRKSTKGVQKKCLRNRQ